MFRANYSSRGILHRLQENFYTLQATCRLCRCWNWPLNWIQQRRRPM